MGKNFSPILLGLALLVPVSRTGAEGMSRDSVLLWAAGRNLVDVAELALSRGGSPEERDLLGNTPLHAGAKHPQMLELLLRSGGDPNARNALGETPLHKAAHHRDSVKVLLAAGADPAAADAFGRTPVDVCMDGGAGAYNLSILSLLMSK